MAVINQAFPESDLFLNATTVGDSNTINRTGHYFPLTIYAVFAPRSASATATIDILGGDSSVDVSVPLGRFTFSVGDTQGFFPIEAPYTYIKGTIVSITGVDLSGRPSSVDCYLSDQFFNTKQN